MSSLGRSEQWATVALRKRRRGLVAAALFFPITAPSQSPIPADRPARALEEVIVTAGKIEEDLFSVPMSVQVLAGDVIDAADLSSLFAAQFEVPGLVVTSAGFFGGGIGLRGVTAEGGGSLAIAPHIDGIYLGSSNLALSRTFDVERIEVLKGPQGTLYGRNATGGSINIISRRPADEFGAAVESALASFDTARVQGYVNVPGDKLALRLAVAGSDGDGFIRNTVDDRKFAEQDYFGARASLRARPTERLTIDLRALRVEDDGASYELWLPPKDFLIDPDDIWLTTVTLPDPYLSMIDEIVSVDVTYDFDRISLQSISGYAKSDTRGLDDCAGLPPLRGCVRGVDPYTYEQRSQELHIRSRFLDSSDWMVGVFFLDADDFTHFHLKLLDPFPINDYSAATDETAYAFFGQATHRIGERWGVTGGVRLSDESHGLTTSGNGSGDSPTPTTARGSWAKTSWRLGLQYAPSNKVFAYANVATGFKSGGFTHERLPTGELDGFDPEELTAYEVGINLRSPQWRWSLLASAFSYDFQDLQVRTFALIDSEPKLVIDNAAAARIYGLDLSATMNFTERLSFAGALVWLPKREFVEFVSAVTGDTLSGNTLSRAPERSASLSLGYERAVRGIGSLSTRLAYSYRSAYFFTRENEPGWEQDGFGLVDLFVRWDSAADRWSLFASGRNLFDARYFNQAFLQSSPGYPANYEIGFRLQF